MVYLTGDTHGELDRFKHGRLRWLGKRDIVVVLGDFGFVWDGSKEEQKKLDWLRKRPYTLLFLDGAHENYDLLAQYPVEERFGGRVQALGGNVYHICRGSVLELEGKKYLFAHAMTSHPDVREEDRYYMRGTMDIDCFFFEGIDGYISMCGHTPTDSIVWKKDRRYLDEPGNSIWCNDRHNVYLLDCGCGFAGGRLACLCLETKERFYA